jgi:hypothetical protein
MPNRWANNRREALSLGRQIATRGIIYHVAKDNLFEDGYFYYRIKDTPALARSSVWRFTQLVQSFSIALSSRLAAVRHLLHFIVSSPSLAAKNGLMVLMTIEIRSS